MDVVEYLFFGKQDMNFIYAADQSQACALPIHALIVSFRYSGLPSVFVFAFDRLCT